jgi:chromosomal replication initiator protein
MSTRRPSDLAARPAALRAVGSDTAQGRGGAPGSVDDSDVSAHAAHILEAIREPLRAQMSLFAYRGFLEPLLPGSLVIDDVGGVDLTILAPSSFLADWVRNHYGDALTASVASVLGRPLTSTRVRVVERGDRPERAVTVAPPSSQAAATSLPQAAWQPEQPAFQPLTAPTPTPRGQRRNGDVVVSLSGSPQAQRVRQPGRRLDPRYSFDSFVVGPGSRMAYSAAMAVAERPGARYSPLFLFGPTGLGKTHLLHAVGHEILARHPQQRVALLSAEQWVNEFIESAHDKAFEAFRKRFRDDVDVLLIDDIQFLAGKSQSQDEFFHTFNALYEGHKQIVVTSDRYPHEIAGLEDRLKTRFQWGLVADVRPPDADTRRQILTRKAVDLGCALPNEVLDFVAASVTTSVRALEGALTRLVAWSQLTREPMNLAEAKEQLRPSLSAGAASPLSIARIIEVVAAYHGMRSKDLVGPTRQRQITRARQIAMFLARQHLQMSLPELGRAFGGRDHTTVLASVQKIDGARADDASLQALLSRLEQTLF